ncbi:HupE/UreJ family protein [Phycisphaeraceae bacterium D3-23]
MTRSRRLRFVSRKCWLFFAAVAVSTLFAAEAHAHKPSDSYLTLEVGEPTLTARWDLAVKDLEFLIGIDIDRDGQVTWAELQARQDDIAALALSRLDVVVDGEEANWSVAALQVVEHSDGFYAVLRLEADRPGDADEITVTYDLLFDADPTHRGLLVFRGGAMDQTHILSPDAPSAEFRPGPGGTNSAWRVFKEFLIEGVWHIWIGLDHILFLLALLLPAVWLRQDKKWEPVESVKPALWAVLKIVTMFTLAHSITLWLAVTEVVSLPSRAIEATIAASIVVTALNNFFPQKWLKGWMIAVGFGLIHGFGFANVLVDLGLRDTALAVSLFAFNVGVELGQMAIVLAFFPAAFALRKTDFYRWGVFTAGSAAIGLLALLWFIERAWNLTIVGF